MVIRAATPADLPGIGALLEAEGWGERVQNRDRLALAVSTATRAVVAEIGGAIVGFGRCITDDVSNGYLSMLVVAPAHRLRGIGRRIVDALTGDDDRITWVLRAGHPGSDRFWDAIGFRRSEIAFERVRRR